MYSQGYNFPVLPRTLRGDSNFPHSFLCCDHMSGDASLSQELEHPHCQGQQSDPHLHSSQLHLALLCFLPALHRQTWEGDLPSPTKCLWHHFLCCSVLCFGKNHPRCLGLPGFKARPPDEKLAGTKCGKCHCCFLFPCSGMYLSHVALHIPSIP